MLCTKIKSGFRPLLHDFDMYIDAHIDTALKVTTEIKKALSSPLAEIITAAIPGNIDDTIRQQLISILGKAAMALTIASNCRQYNDATDQLNCFIKQLQEYDPHLQDAVLQKLASLLAGGLDGNRLQQSLYDLYTQAKYSAIKAKL
jgi:hypothetical protein